MTDYLQRVNQLMNGESYNETEPWNDQFLAKMDRLGLMLSPVSSGPDCVQAPWPASDEPDRWPTPSYIVDKDPKVDQQQRTKDVLTLAFFIGHHDPDYRKGGWSAAEAVEALGRLAGVEAYTLMGIVHGLPPKERFLQ